MSDHNHPGHFSRHDTGDALHPNKSEDGTKAVGSVAAFDFMRRGPDGSRFHGRRGSEVTNGYRQPDKRIWAEERGPR
jgi:hypothetical protein